MTTSAIWKVNVYVNVTSDAATCSLCNKSIARKYQSTKGLIGHLNVHPEKKRKYEELKKHDDDLAKVEAKKQKMIHSYAQVGTAF